MKPFIICLSLLLSLKVSAQDYNVKNIADSLKIKADVVLRFDDNEIKIVSPKEAILKHKYAITILNEDGKHYSGYFNVYGKFNKLNKVIAKLYDSTGKLLKTVKKKDMLDMAYNDQVSLISDDRTVRYDFAWKTYPYTIEIEDEEELKGFFTLPEWTPVENASFAVEKSSLTVSVPKDYVLHYKLLQNTKPPVEHISDNIKTYE